MTIEALLKYFRVQLSERYTENESDKLFSIFVDELLGFPPLEQKLKRNFEISEKGVLQLKHILEELKTGKPYQQILGYTHFFGETFFVDESVLIPRPETEELVELALEKILKTYSSDKKIKILDIGTGSGIIPIILKKHIPNADIFAIDISEKALAIAKKNAERLRTNVHFSTLNFLQENLNDQWDVIISNPPYIGIDEKNEIDKSVQNFEPNLALFSPTFDALIFYRKIAQESLEKLNPGGMIFLEINQKLGKETLEIFTPHFPKSILLKDISGNNRFIFCRK